MNGDSVHRHPVHPAESAPAAFAKRPSVIFLSSGCLYFRPWASFCLYRKPNIADALPLLPSESLRISKRNGHHAIRDLVNQEVHERGIRLAGASAGIIRDKRQLIREFEGEGIVGRIYRRPDYTDARLAPALYSRADYAPVLKR